MLKNQYFITGKLSDLRQAIETQKQAVAATPADHPDAVMYLHNLCGLVRTKFQQTGEAADLEEAYKLGRQAANLCPKDHPNRPAYLNSLGTLLGDLFAKKGEAFDLDEAISLGENTVNMTDNSHSQRADRLTNLGDRLFERFTKVRVMADFERAIACYQAALNHLPSSIMSRINAARGLTRCYGTVSDWKQAYRVADIAIQLAPKLISKLSENRDKQDTLSQVFGLSSEAAAVSLNAGKGAVAALRFLERSCGLLQTSLEDMQTDVLELKEEHPELADQFVRLRDELEAHRISAANDIGLKSQLSKHSKAGDELDEFILKIREQPGCEDFLLGPSELGFREAAVYGPLITINVSKYGCHAVIVERSQIRSLALPSLAIEDLRKKSHGVDLDSPKLLEWLWDTVTDPILKALGITIQVADCDLPHLW